MEGFEHEGRRILTAAKAIAKSLRSGYIGTGHVLAAILDGDTEPANWILEDFHVMYGKIVERISRSIKKREQRPLVESLPFSPNLKRALEVAATEASVREYGKVRSPLIGSVQLLLGLISVEEGVAAQVLRGLGIDEGRLRDRARRWYLEKDEVVAPCPAENAPYSTPVLDRLTFDLAAGQWDPGAGSAVGRDTEVEACLAIHLRRNTRNPVLVGEPGVGKTTVLRAVARQMASAPRPRAARRVRGIDLARVLDEGRGPVASAGLFATMAVELRAASSTLIVIDDIHVLGNRHLGQEARLARSVLRPMLAEGQLSCLGATTPEEFELLRSEDPAFWACFHVVPVAQPDPETAVAMVMAVASDYAVHHEVRIAEGVAELAVQLVISDLPERRLPLAAIDLLDQACVLACDSSDRTVGDEEVRRAMDLM